MSFWSEFNSSSQKEWDSKIVKDLKGKNLDINSDCNPFIFKTTHFTHSKFPRKIYLNGDFDMQSSSNENLLESLGYGINSITLNNSDFNEKDLANIMHEIIDTHVIFSSENILKIKDGWLNWIKSNPGISGSFRFDPIADFHKSGKWVTTKEGDLNNWHQFYNECNDLIFQTIYIDGTIYGNSAFNSSSQVAYISAHLNEYFELINLSPNQTIKVIIRNAVGVNYFSEIAKLRALRNVITSIANHRKIKIELLIESVTSTSVLSPIDIDTNLIRITASAMASFIGGSDIISNVSYDCLSDQKNKNAKRLSINISHIIKEESKIHIISDPLKGSHVIEEMTDHIKKESWELFKSIENKGGWLSYLSSENILKLNKENVLKKTSEIINGDHAVIGFNKYRLSSDENINISNKIDLTSNDAFVELNITNLI